MPIVQISERDWELGKNYPAEIAINANVKETLRALVPVRARMTRSAEARGAVEPQAGRAKTTTGP